MYSMRLAWSFLLMLSAVATHAGDADQAARASLWSEVDAQVYQLRAELGFDRLSPAVRDALKAVPREQFIPTESRHLAYENRPISIGFGQTISQPLIVAAMTELLNVEPGQRVFELGTGSAYQAAVLATIGADVYSVEIIPPLAERARQTLDRLGFDNVQTRVGDGYFGWTEAAPFDAIIVTAANDHVPLPLLQQLKPGGRMVIPVGSRYSTQKLVLITRDENGMTRTREILPVTFVPLTGER